MDQTLASMSATTSMLRKNKEVEIVLFGRDNLMYLMRPKIQYEIKIGDWIALKGNGVIPFGKVDFI